MIYQNRKCDALAIRSWLKAQMGHRLRREENASLDEHNIEPTDGVLEIRNALGTGSVATGAALQPAEGLLAGVTLALKDNSGIRQASRSIEVGTGGRWWLPFCEVRNTSGQILDENQTIASGTDLTFGREGFEIWDVSTPLVKVSNALANDVPRFDEELGRALGEVLATEENSRFSNGSGLHDLQGLVTAATAVSAASATDIRADDVLALLRNVGEAHLDPAASRFMANSAVLLTLRGLKDSSGSYIFRDGRLFDYEVIRNTAMSSSISSGVTSLVFGNFRRYAIAETPAIELRRVRERYLESNQTAYQLHRRLDARIVGAQDVPFVRLTH